MGDDGRDALPPVPVGLLHRHRGGPSRPPCVYRGRLLGADDLAEVRALHHAARATMAPHMVAHDDDDFLAARLGPRGVGLGLAVDGALIAYALLGLPEAPGGEMGRHLPDGPAAEARVAELDGVAVDPAWHGNGLQRMLLSWRCAAAYALGRRHVLATASPANHVSLPNLLEAGLRGGALCRLYDGSWRYVLHLDVTAPDPDPAEAPRWLPADAIAEQEAVLAEGWQACGHRARQGRMEIRFEPGGQA